MNIIVLVLFIQNDFGSNYVGKKLHDIIQEFDGLAYNLKGGFDDRMFEWVQYFSNGNSFQIYLDVEPFALPQYEVGSDFQQISKERMQIYSELKTRLVVKFVLFISDSAADDFGFNLNAFIGKPITEATVSLGLRKENEYILISDFEKSYRYNILPNGFIELIVSPSDEAERVNRIAMVCSKDYVPINMFIFPAGF